MASWRVLLAPLRPPAHAGQRPCPLGLGTPSTLCQGVWHSATARCGPEGGMPEPERDVSQQRSVLAALGLLGIGSGPASGINS